MALAVGAGVLGAHTTGQVDHLIETRPHLPATIVSIHGAPLGSRSGPSLRVSLGDNKTASVTYSDYVAGPYLGDVIDVVTDPSNPGTVIPVSYLHSATNSPVSYVGIVVLIALLGTCGSWGYGATRRANARTVLDGGNAVVVTVVATAGSSFTICAPDGTELRWRLRSSRHTPARGAELAAIGRLRPGGRAALLNGRWVLWTARPFPGGAEPTSRWRRFLSPVA